MTLPNSKPRALDCGCTRWYISPPRAGELVYCATCDEYTRVGAAHTRAGEVFYPDYEWRSIPPQITSGRFTGFCTVDLCGFQLEHRNIEKLRKSMESHHLHEHGTSTLLRRKVTTDVPVKYANPPF